jgi:hypothetical protein
LPGAPAVFSLTLSIFEMTIMTTTNDVLASSNQEVCEVNHQLAELAARANAAHQRVIKAAGEGLLAAFEAGQSLLAARKLCLGRFLAWLPQNFKYSLRTAERYMEFAEQCHSIGGIDSTRVSSLPHQELGRIWSQILGRGGKKTPCLPSAKGEEARTVSPADVCEERDRGEPAADATARVPAIERAAPERGEHSDTPVDRMPPLVTMFAELIEECRRVATGDDCYDGEYAECLLTSLKPHYDDLLDYMEYRQEWRSRPGYTGASSR